MIKSSGGSKRIEEESTGIFSIIVMARSSSSVIGSLVALSVVSSSLICMPFWGMIGLGQLGLSWMDWTETP